MPCSTPPTISFVPNPVAGLARTAVVLSDATPLLAHIRRRSGLRDRDAAEARTAQSPPAQVAPLGLRAAGLTVGGALVVDEADARARGVGATAREAGSIRLHFTADRPSRSESRRPCRPPLGCTLPVPGRGAGASSRHSRSGRTHDRCHTNTRGRARSPRSTTHAATHRAFARRGAFDAAGEIGQIAGLARGRNRIARPSPHTGCWAGCGAHVSPASGACASVPVSTGFV